MIISKGEYKKIIEENVRAQALRSLAIDMSFNRYAVGGFTSREALRACGFTDAELDEYAMRHGAKTKEEE